MTTYGSWLRHHRTQRGLSQETLGELVGVDGTYINKIEHNVVKRPLAPLRSRIHAVFGTNDADPDLFPLLSRADQRAVVHTSRPQSPSVGERIERLLIVA